eukprot:757647-Pelagomonas_calceolata.AAC.1
MQKRSLCTEFKVHEQATHSGHYTRSFTPGQGGISNRTCMGSTEVPGGRLLARTSTAAWARGQ